MGVREVCPRWVTDNIARRYEWISRTDHPIDGNQRFAQLDTGRGFTAHLIPGAADM